MGFWVGLVAWVVYVVRSLRDLPQLIAPRQVSDAPDHFPQAHAAFLAGRWSEAEGLLTDVLAIEARDPPALLLLTGLYRHTGRLAAARTLLEEIRKLEVAEPWWLEVRAEQQRLQRAIEAAESEEADESGTEPAAGEEGSDPSAAENKGPERAEKNRDESADLAAGHAKAA